MTIMKQIRSTKTESFGDDECLMGLKIFHIESKLLKFLKACFSRQAGLDQTGHIYSSRKFNSCVHL